MKLLAVLVSLLVSSAAFAFENQCVLTAEGESHLDAKSVLFEMEMRQHPKADIAGYILNVNFEGFQVFASEADGNYYGKITTATGVASESESHDTDMTLSASEGDKTIVVVCF